MNFVAEWITMSAPHSTGRHRYGVANVLSTISGSSCSCAMSATVSMSSTFPAGFPIVSPKNALVFARTAFRHASGSSGWSQEMKSYCNGFAKIGDTVSAVNTSKRARTCRV